MECIMEQYAQCKLLFSKIIKQSLKRPESGIYSLADVYSYSAELLMEAFTESWFMYFDFSITTIGWNLFHNFVRLQNIFNIQKQLN